MELLIILLDKQDIPLINYKNQNMILEQVLHLEDKLNQDNKVKDHTLFVKWIHNVVSKNIHHNILKEC